MMRTYTALAVVGIPAGALLGLTADQARRRAHLIKPLEVDKKTGFGTYEVLARTEFKVGEKFASNIDVGKAHASSLEPAEVTEKRHAASAKEAARAKDVAALRERAAAQAAELEQLRPKAAVFDLLPVNVREDALKKAADAQTASTDSEKK